MQCIDPDALYNILQILLVCPFDCSFIFSIPTPPPPILLNGIALTESAYARCLADAECELAADLFHRRGQGSQHCQLVPET